MPTDYWNYYESGVTGWTQISNTLIPNPNSTPIKITQKSTQKKIDLVDGDFGYLTPENKYTKEPCDFSWFFQSGATLVNKFKQLNRDATLIKIQAPMTDVEWTGKIINVDETLKIWGREDYRDITVTMEQQSG